MSTHNIQFHDKSENLCSLELLKKILLGLKNEFKLAIVKKPSMFQLLRFDCNYNKNYVKIYLQWYIWGTTLETRWSLKGMDAPASASLALYGKICK